MTSAATSAVAGVNNDPTGGVTSQDTTEDEVLTADTSTLDGDGLGTLITSGVEMVVRSKEPPLTRTP